MSDNRKLNMKDYRLISILAKKLGKGNKAC